MHYKDTFLYKHSKIIFTSPQQLYIMLAVLLPLILIAETIVLYKLSGYTTLRSMRNFYGFLNVREKSYGTYTTRMLIHGNIFHGAQLISGKLRYEPTMYFTEQSGVGVVLTYFSAKESPINVGILGLGIGTLAAYADKGDHYRFYEINPQVIQVANEDFTFLKDTKAKVSIIEGDGRLSLEKEVQMKDPEKFDVLVMDAFSDDSVPFHLLTKEATQIYLSRLKDNGVLAFNISNKYLDLRAPLCRSAKEFELTCIFVPNDKGLHAMPSHWIIMTKNKDVLAIPALVNSLKKQKIKDSTLWTDNYSNLLQVIK